MVNYGFDLRFLPQELLTLKDSLDAYDWCLLVYDYITDTVSRFNSAKDKNGNISPEASAKFLSVLFPIVNVMQKYPVIVLDPAVESLVEDTIPDLKNIRVPFPGFFVNKKFPVKDGYIFGMCIVDMQQLLYHDFLSIGMTKERSLEQIEKIRKSPAVNGEFPAMSFMYLYVNDTEGSISMVGTDEIFDREKDVPDDVFAVMKQAMLYAANISNLITSHVDPVNPGNVKNDVRMVPHRRAAGNAKSISERDNRFSIIRVFGDLGKYVQTFNKEKRKYTIKNQEATVVRGHWRHLTSERYKAKRGEVIWIPPFIKGMDKELHSRIIKLKR